MYKYIKELPPLATSYCVRSLSLVLCTCVYHFNFDHSLDFDAYPQCLLSHLSRFAFLLHQPHSPLRLRIRRLLRFRPSVSHQVPETLMRARLLVNQS